MLCLRTVFANLLAFVLLIGPLIFIHELGHLIAAKLVDVKVNRFSIGLGPALLKLRIGETEYVLAPIPLGGYVSMLGQRPDEDFLPSEADRALHNKPLWARYLVLGAGPAANLLLPILVYFFYFVVNHVMVTPAIIGTVTPGSAAEAAGLQQGDRIVSIEGRDVRSWEEMAQRVAKAPGRELQLQIDRAGKRLDRAVTPSKTIHRNSLGVAETRGRLGVLTVFYSPQIGIVDLDSPAYAEGLRTGDVVTSINGEPVKTVEELEQLLAIEGRRDALIRLTYLRPVAVHTTTGTLLFYESHHAQLLPRKNDAGEPVIGLLPARSFVRAVDPGSPAAAAGIRAGDHILGIDGEPFTHWVLVQETFARKRDRPVRLELQSPGEPSRIVEVTLGELKWREIYGQDRTLPWFGAHPYDKYDQAPPEHVRGRFTYALSKALDETWTSIHMTWTTLLQMFTLERGVEELSSFIGIYTVAGTAYERGPGDFLLLLGLLSVNLGIINLLPIPVLDGGHLMFFTIEAIRRRPLGQRSREIASAIGLFIIVVLLFIAARNDIVRYWL